jgi:hypothetical protein
VPVSQPLLIEQAPPAVHGEQAPALQTRLVPQLVPLATLVAVATHVCVPVEQSVLPTTQGLVAGVHARPAVHDTHDPPLQTWFVPQFVPLVAFERLEHTCVPVEQE